MSNSLYVEQLDFCPYDNVGEAVCTINLNQRVACWNPVSTTTLGYSFDDVFGKNCWEVLQGKTEDGIPHCQENCSVFRQISIGIPVEPFNLRIRAKDGELMLVNVSTVPVYNPLKDNVLTGIVHMMRPVEDVSVHDDYFRVRLLGSIEVERPDGTLVEGNLWRRVKTRALLSYLALRYDQPVYRDILIDRLWSHLEHDAALRNLNTTIYNLRRSLEPNLRRGADSKYIVYQSDSYRLTSDCPFWLDVTVFETVVKRARQTRDIDESIRLYETARKLYRGDYLQDLYAAEQWQSAEQTWLRELYLTVLDELAAAYLDNGNQMEARDIYLQIVDEDACRERSCVRLIRLELEMDNQELARHHCTQLCAVLEDDLGIEIGEELQLLCQELA